MRSDSMVSKNDKNKSIVKIDGVIYLCSELKHIRKDDGTWDIVKRSDNSFITNIVMKCQEVGE